MRDDRWGKIRGGEGRERDVEKILFFLFSFSIAKYKRDGHDIENQAIRSLTSRGPFVSVLRYKPGEGGGEREGKSVGRTNRKGGEGNAH